MSAADDAVTDVLSYWDPLISETIKDVAGHAKEYQHGDLLKRPDLMSSLSLLRDHLAGLKRECLLVPGTPWVLQAVPPEYTLVFQQGEQLVSTMSEAVRVLTSAPETTQDQIVIVVTAAKDLLSAYADHQQALLAIDLADNKSDCLGQLSLIVKSARVVVDNPLYANVESLLRSLTTLAELLNEWYGERYQLSLDNHVADLHAVRPRALLLAA